MLKFDDEIKKLTNPKIHPILDQIAEAANSLADKAAKIIEVVWPPKHNDIRELFNDYLDLIWGAYTQKISLITSGLISSINNKDFLSYALLGRSLIEHTAVIRYYHNLIVKNIQESVKRGAVSEVEIKKLIEILDKHIRGHRFDWDTYFKGDFEKLTKEYKIEDYKSQVNVKTCLDKWVEEQPEIKVLYDLFCDLVHPNIGSTFLVMKGGNGSIIFGGNEGHSIGIDVFYHTFVGLAATIKKFSEYINGLLYLYFPVGKYER